MQGCAVATYGACVLIHGGFTPADGSGGLAAIAAASPGAATSDLRALVLQPDPMRPLPGEHRVVRRTVVRQLMPDGSEYGEGGGGEGGEGAGAGFGSGFGLAGAPRNWWEAVGGAPAPAQAGAALAAGGGGAGQAQGADVWRQPPGSAAGAAPGAAAPGAAQSAQGTDQQRQLAAAAAAAAAGCGASRPCAPPSARAGHHMAVDSRTCRLWMYGGWRHVSTASPSIWGSGAYGGAADLDVAAAPPERRPADSEPCCYWAQLPSSGRSDGDSGGGGGAAAGGGAAGAGAACAAGGNVLEAGAGGGGGGGGEGGGCKGSSGGVPAWRDAAYVGGEAVVEQVTWHRLPLVAAASGSSTGDTGRCSSSTMAGAASRRDGAAAATAPPFPDPLRTLAVRVHDGALYVLSTTSRPVPGAPHHHPQHLKAAAAAGRHPALRGPAAPPSPACHRWLLHRIDTRTGLCQLLQEPPELQCIRNSSSANTSNSGSNAGGGCSVSGGDVPVYDDDAAVMADDVLPYFYVYGSRQLSHAGAPFEPAIFRLDLRAAAAAVAAAKEPGSGGGDGCSGDFSGGGGWWERVPVAGAQRLHAARGALGAASGGTVVLVGGVRDARRGVEARVQVALPPLVSWGCRGCIRACTGMPLAVTKDLQATVFGFQAC